MRGHRGRRRTAALALALALTLLGAEGSVDLPPEWPDPPAASAVAFVLADADTGQVIAARNAERRRPVASTVKLLTALSVLSRASPDEVVEVGDEVRGVAGAGVGLDPGERWTVRDLLEALVARSGNDAAVALAAHVGGSVDGFVELMRADLRELGVTGATLTSPNGLDDSNRLSALDLAVISRAVLARPALRALVGRAQVELPGLGTVPTRNLLLELYPDATGLKTGFTELSGWSVVGSARRAGRELVAVVLGSRGARARFDEAAALLDHGFERFRPAEPVSTVRLVTPGGGATVLRPEPGPEPLVPRRAGTLEREVPVPVEVPAPRATLTGRTRWAGAPIATRTFVAGAPRGATRAPGTGTGPPAVGRWLWGRAYAGLRAGVSSGALAP